MREIKCKGKTEVGNWIYGYVFKSWNQVFILWGTTNGDLNMIEVIPETVGQYIGRKDKNGKEIYGGDILRYADLLSDGWIMSEAKTIGLVNWINSKCGFAPQEIHENSKGGHYVALWDSIDEIEVIGNIHDNI